MPVSREYIEFICELFSGLGPVENKPFFGGRGFHIDDAIFGFVIGETLYMRTDETTRPDYIEADAVPFSYEKKDKRVIVEAYYSLPEFLFDDADEAVIWAEKALQIGIQMKRKKENKGT